jgi:hypothetical protein
LAKIFWRLLKVALGFQRQILDWFRTFRSNYLLTHSIF